LAKIWKWAWKCRWLILIGLIAAAVIVCWPGITNWLKLQLPGKSKWDWIEKILMPIAPPAAIGFGVFFLDKNAKDRESQRAENDSKNQAIQIFFERISAILLERQVINLANSAKRLGPEYKDPMVESARDVIRAQSLAVLRTFSEDTEKKSAVMRFLVESEIIASLRIPLEKVNLSGASLSGAILSGADLSWANLSEARLSWANFSGASLIGANLSRANFSVANLSGADLSWANLSGADLSGANFSGADLSGANFSGADLSWANLSEANLNGADLSGARLTPANLSEARLSGANFSGASLIGANLSEARLTPANLSRADLSGANFEKIKWDVKTKWPDRSLLEGATNVPGALKKELGL
jgi:uncharacterized protein YjbI with pentapeptide repeats